jgi:RNA polymerase sigma factor for flagellar operon FliA
MSAAKGVRESFSGCGMEEHRGLWQSYVASRDGNLRERLVEAYLPYARIIAATLYAGRHHDEFEFNEYMQFAVVGLME